MRRRREKRFLIAVIFGVGEDPDFLLRKTKI